MSACACIGPTGNCPCIHRQRGENSEITEIFISTDVFALLPDEDKRKINELKMKALGMHLTKSL